HVEKVHNLVSQMYQFVARIFIQELNDPHNSGFKPGNYLNETFFDEAFMHLTTRQGRRMNDKMAKMHSLVSKHIGGYLHKASITKLPFLNGGRSAMYEAGHMVTTYCNNIAAHYADYLHGAVNILLNVKQALAELHQQMSDSGSNPTDIREAVWKQITEPAKKAKEAIIKGQFKLPGIDQQTKDMLSALQPVFAVYPGDIEFENNSIEDDSQLYPERHFKAFFELAKVHKRIRGSTFQCFPLRTSWTPSHMHIDTPILRQQILGLGEGRGMPVKDSWRLVVDIEHNAFKSAVQAEPDKLRHFWGSIETDGMAISIIKKTEAEKSRHPGFQKVEGREPKPK
ncbi:hypothetical protein LPJ61_005920, partial [Coemansia biformis]